MQHVDTKRILIIVTLFWSLLSPFSICIAKMVYVVEQFNIGLHKAPTVTSPIIKLVQSGTRLTVVDEAEGLLYVQTAEGLQGWISSQYTTTQKPVLARVTELEQDNKRLQAVIAQNPLEGSTATPKNAVTTQRQLQQQLNSERLKVGELQAQLTDLKTYISDIDEPSKVQDDMNILQQKNEQLILQLEMAGIAVETTEDLSEGSYFVIQHWKKSLMVLVSVFIVGIVIGAIVLDYRNRNRHGGFRI